MDDPFLGIDGASSNITLGSISNYGRFSRNKTLSAAAVTEILAIPEIWEKKLFQFWIFHNTKLPMAKDLIPLCG